ncbi:MAG: hypothetical protein WBQ23_16915 [Bacteroidota bacterium]
MRNMSFFLIAFLLSFPTFAQQNSSDTPAPASLAQEFRTGISVDSDAAAQLDASVRQWRPFDPQTIGVQVLSGAAGGAIGAGAGFLAGFGVFGGTFEGFFAGVYGGYALSTLVGAPLGVYLGGEYMGGVGPAWGAMGGGAVGSLIGLAALSADGEGETGVPIAIMAAIVSPIIGYHLAAESKTNSVHPMRSELTPRRIEPVMPRRADPVTPRPDLQMTVLSVPF